MSCPGIDPDLHISSCNPLFYGTSTFYVICRCLQSAINGCGRNFDPYIDPDLLELIFQTLNHTNRFVRETGYYVCGALVGCNAHHGKIVFFLLLIVNSVHLITHVWLMNVDFQRGNLL